MRREGWVVVRGENYETRRSRVVGKVEEVRDLGARAQEGEVGSWVYVRMDIHNWSGRHPEESSGLLELKRWQSLYPSLHRAQTWPGYRLYRHHQVEFDNVTVRYFSYGD